MCFAFDHPLRNQVDNNWHITKTSLDARLTPASRDLVKQIFMGLHSPEWGEKVHAQVMHDSGQAGCGSSSIAHFGGPGTGKFEFVLMGRHRTRRRDGDSAA